MKNLHVKMMILWGVLCLASTCMVSEAMAQTLRPVAQTVLNAAHSIDFQMVTPFSVTQTMPATAGDVSKSLKKATFAVAPDVEISRLYNRNLAGMRLAVPYQDQIITVDVLQVDALASDFKLIDQKGQLLPFKKGKFYRGMVLNDPNTLVSVNLFENEINGIIATPQHGNLNFGKLTVANNVQDYIVYSDRDWLVPFSFECATQTPPDYARVMQDALNAKLVIPVNEAKCIRLGWEVTNDLHLAKGNDLAATNNYITGAYNNLATMYVNEGIRTNLAQVIVWTTADNYTTNNTSAALDEFVANRPPTTGIDLVHLIAAFPASGSGGGRAYVGVLCHPTIRHAYSQVFNTYSAVPAFSWTVEVLTHEMGHNLGSPHTHDCRWPVTATWPTGGALDNCYPVENGTCAAGPAPTAPPAVNSGGTVMSYCHLVPTVGINFNNGFGTEPGNLIRARVGSATCLTSCNTLLLCCGTPSAFTVAANMNDATISWIGVTGAISYNFRYRTVGGAWLTSNPISPSVTLTGLATGTTYEYEVQSVCSNGATDCPFSTTSSFGTCCNAPAPPTASAVTSTGATISWAAVAGATSYNLRYRVGTNPWVNVHQTAISTVLTTLAPGTTYEFQVQSICSNFALSCPYSASGTFTTLPACCGTPTGFTATPTSNGVTITWTAIPGATSYNFRYRLVGGPAINLTSALPSITITGLTPATVYQYQVQAVCNNLATNCPYTIVANFTTLPTCCGTPSGFAVTPNNTGAVITWTAIPTATSYNFRYRVSPSGSWVISNPTSPTVTLTGLTTATAYDYEVQAVCNNLATDCPFSTTATFTTTTPSTCCGTPAGFSVTPTISSLAITWGAVTGAISYNFRYRVSPSGSWVTSNPTSPNVTLTGLTAGTAYDYEVQSVCSNGATDCPFTTTATFTTLPTCCGTPTGLAATPAINGATISWAAVTGATSYNYRYRVSPLGAWVTSNTTSLTAALSGLTAATAYDYEVQAVCGSGATDCSFSTTATFTTLPTCCGTPTGLAATPAINGATISWAAVTGATSYNYRYRVSPSGAWVTSNTTSLTATLSSLTAATAYDYEVQAVCSNLATNCPFSTTATFTTLPTCCGTPTGFTTTATANGVTASWGAVSGATSYLYHYRVSGGSWSADASVTTPTFSLTGLFSSTGYEYEVKAVCSNLATNCLFSATQLFTTSAAAVCCGTPSGFTTTTTTTTATVNWSAVSGASSYLFRYRVAGTLGGTVLTTATPNITVTGLNPGTIYEFEARAICTNGATCPYSPIGNFTTLPTCCGTPSGFAVTPTITGATITWGTVAGATSYNFRYRLAPSGTWVTSNPTSPTVTLTGLAAATGYQYEVQAVCSNLATNCPYSTTGSFTTLQTCCGTPTGFVATPTTNGATISWTAVSGATSYNFRYRVSPSGGWVFFNPTSSTITLIGLAASTAYDYEAQAVCGNLATNCPFSATRVFTTLAQPVCCGTPSGFTTATTSTSATISWIAISGASSYQLRYRVVGTLGGTVLPTTSATLTITGLNPGTTYEFEVRAICTNGSTCPYSPIGNFRTLPTCCGTPTGFAVAPSVNGATITWAAVSGATSYNFRYRLAPSGAWVNSNPTSPTVTLTGLAAATSYQYEVQAVCGNLATNCPFSATQHFSTTAPACCGTPTSFSVSLGTTNATLSWGAILGATSYNVRIRVGSTGAWANFTTATNSIGFSVLTAGTTYQCEVQSVCSNGSTSCPYSATQSFTTLPNNSCCATLSNFTANVGSTTVTLGWSAIAGATSYNVRVRIGTGAWTNLTTATNSINLAGLTANTTYQYEVQPVCGSSTVVCAYSATRTFTTAAGPVCCGTASGLSVTNVNPSTVSMSWTGVSGVTSYVLQLQPVSSAGWTYTITGTSVSFYNLAPNTTYQWQVRAVCANGSVCWSNVASFTTPAPCADPNEPNNSSSAARTMTLNTIYNGTMPSGDADWFKFTIASVGTFNVSLSNLGNDYALELYASNATTLLASSNNPNINNESIVRNNSTANTLYYVKVSPSTSLTFDPYTCYRLRVGMGSSLEYNSILGEAIELPRRAESARMTAQPFEASIDLFPNPTTGNLVLQIATADKMVLTPMVEITDMFGRVVQQKTFPAGQTIENQYHLNLNGYQDGVYLVRVQLGNQVTTHKVRVQR
jgi:hypothetical protein